MSRTLPDESEAATLFAALGDGTRLALLRRLGDGERHAISRLAEGTGLTRQAVTKHLHVLEHAGLVTCVRAGRESLYCLEPAPLGTARRYIDAVAGQWDEALARLGAFVER